MRKAFERLIDERLILSVILVNTFAIFLRAFPDVRARHDAVLFTIDYICTCYFVIEMATKVGVYGWRTYLARGWNRFDFAVVVLSSPALLAPIIDVEGFTVVLLLRLGRLLRFFRLLRFVPDADRLWSGIGRGLKASVGVLLALLLYNFALGLCACYLFRDAAPAYFGDPVISIYSMFKVFTVEGWFDVPDTIAANSSLTMGVLARGFFAFSVSTGGLLGLSMANAVFVDEMVMDNTNELESELKIMQEEIMALRDENARAFEKLTALLTAREGEPPSSFGASPSSDDDDV